MADNYTFKVNKVCSGGEHISIQILKNNVAIGIKQVCKTDMLKPDLKIEDVLEFILSKAIIGATTPAQRKTAMESVVVTI
jgi:hypothetical protein